MGSEPHITVSADAGSARDRILLAAKNRFAASGFDGASTRQISDDAGVAQSLLLYYFKTKDALWRAVVDQIFQKFYGYVDIRNCDSAVPPERQLMIIASQFIDQCQGDPDLYRFMTIQGRYESERLIWMTQTHIAPFFDHVTHLIRLGQARNTIEAGDPGLLYYAMFSIAGTLSSLAPEIRLVAPETDPGEKCRILPLIERLLLARP